MRGRTTNIFFRLAVAFAFGFALCPLRAQVLTREIESREVSINVGGTQNLLTKSLVAREVSFFIGGEPSAPYHENVSREVSFLIVSPGAPPPVTGFIVIPSPLGDRASLNWNNYNQYAVNDIVRFDIYVADVPFNNVTGMTPYKTVAAGTAAIELAGLAIGQDHYLAIVAVDGLGNYDPAVTYSAAYVISPEVISREVSLSINFGSSNADSVSREISLAVGSPGAPLPITGFTAIPSPAGDSVSLDWNSYNQYAQNDIARFDIYVSENAFSNITGLTPFMSVPAGAATAILNGLPANHDHYVAIVAVDVLGNYNTAVTYSAAYVISPQAISRELSVFIGGEPMPPYRELVSREASLLVTDTNVPAPVTGIGSGFDAIMSQTVYRAIDINWSGYNEPLQNDVSRYRIYVDTKFFTNVTGMVPFAYVTNGLPRASVGGLFAGNIYYIAVVAEDAQGNFNPSVYSVSAITSDRSIWRRAYFTVPELANAALESTLWGDSADPDGDGYGNLVEYALGGDLREASDLNRASSGKLLPYAAVARVGNARFYEFRFRRYVNASALGLRYDVNLSQDLTIWYRPNTAGQSWTTGSEIVGPAEPGMIGFESVALRLAAPLNSNATKVFSRLQVSLTETSDTAESLAIPASNPIGYWRFDEPPGATNAANAVGSQSGTPFGGVTFGSAPHEQRGFSVHFDGQPGSFLSLGQFHAGDNITVESWVRLDTIAPSENAIIARWNGSYLLEINNGRARFLVRNQSNVQGQVFSPIISSLSQWHQVVGIFSGGVLTVYVDTVPSGSMNIGGVLQNAGPIPDQVLVGAYGDGFINAGNLKGYLDEIAIYNRALTAEEITAHYNAGK